MTKGTMAWAWAASATVGILAAVAAVLTLHKEPPAPPRNCPTACFSDAWDAAATAINRKSNRLQLPIRIVATPLAPEPVAPPPPPPPLPARDLVQVAPTVLAVRPVVEDNLCTRHHLRKVWIDRRHWRCRA